MTGFTRNFVLPLMFASMALGACASTRDRIANIGQPPPLSPITVPPGIVHGAPVLVPQPVPTLYRPRPIRSGAWVHAAFSAIHERKRSAIF